MDLDAVDLTCDEDFSPSSFPFYVSPNSKLGRATVPCKQQPSPPLFDYSRPLLDKKLRKAEIASLFFKDTTQTRARRVVDLTRVWKDNVWTWSLYDEDMALVVQRDYHWLSRRYRELAFGEAPSVRPRLAAAAAKRHQSAPHFLDVRPAPRCHTFLCCLEWMGSMCSFFDYSYQTYHASVSLFSRYWYAVALELKTAKTAATSPRSNIVEPEVFTIAAACLWIARCNHEESCAADYDTWYVEQDQKEADKGSDSDDGEQTEPGCKRHPCVRDEVLERRVMGMICPTPFQQADLDKWVLRVMDRCDAHSVTAYDIAMRVMFTLAYPPNLYTPAASGESVARAQEAMRKLQSLDTLVAVQDLLVVMSLFDVEQNALQVAVAVLEHVVGFDDVFQATHTHTHARTRAIARAISLFCFVSRCCVCVLACLQWSGVHLHFLGQKKRLTRDFRRVHSMMRFMVSGAAKCLPKRVFAVGVRCLYPDIEGGTQVSDLYHKYAHHTDLFGLVKRCVYSGWVEAIRIDKKKEETTEKVIIMQMDGRLFFHYFE